MNEPIKVFVSYSHQDDELRKELGKHLSGLERRELIKLWLDRDIEAGLEWANEIDQNLEQAAIILLLVSADFIASEYCHSIEMTRAVARHEAGTAKVIPVIIGACDWTSAPFGKLQAIPPDNQAVATWGNGDKYARATAWTLVSQEISNVAQQIRDRCVDDCHSNYKNAPFDGSAWINSDRGNSGMRIIRGGSWVNDAADCRSAIRFYRTATDSFRVVGLRVVAVSASTS
jgi:TIR domain